MAKIQVLIVEDDPMVMEIHKNYILSVEGFSLMRTAFNGKEALEIIKNSPPDLLILDIFMPKMGGIKTLHNIRRQNEAIDVVVVTAAKEVETVEEVMRLGPFDYIIKPFSFERIHATLQSYKKFKNKTKNKGRELSQEDVDKFIDRGRNYFSASSLPKGLNSANLQNVCGILEGSPEPLSTDEVAELAGFSRVTAWRYLEFLVSSGRVAVKHVPHCNAGRPIKKYSLI